MEDFESLIENYLKEINYLMKHRTSDKIIYTLKSDVSSLLMAMEMSGAKVKLPDRFLFNLERGNDDVIDRKIEKRFIQNFNSFFELNSNLASIDDQLYNCFGEGYILDYHKSISLKDVAGLVYDFFDYYDQDIRKFYEKKVEDNKIVFVPDAYEEKYAGMTFQIYSQDDSFIISKYDKSIYSALTLAHELIHGYVDQFNNTGFEHVLNYFVNNLEEIYPMFIEYVFINYLHEIRFNEKEIRALEVNSDVNLFGFLNDYKMLLSLSEPEFIYDEEDLFNSYMDSEKYSYGQILGFHYYLNYLDNPNKTKVDLMDFSLDDSHDRLYKINNYGLKEEEVLSSKKLIKDMKRHFNYK